MLSNLISDRKSAIASGLSQSLLLNPSGPNIFDVAGAVGGIAAKGVGMSYRFTKSIVGGFVSGATKIGESLLEKATPKDSKLGRKDVSTVVKDDPYHSTIGPGRVIPLRKGDSEANILAKMFNFMMKKREEEKKYEELKRNFQLEQIKEDERRHKKLIDSLLKRKTKAPKEDKVGGMWDFIKSIFDKISSLLSAVYDKISNITTSIANSLNPLFESIFEQLDFFRTAAFPKILKAIKSLKLLRLGAAGAAIAGIGVAADYIRDNPPNAYNDLPFSSARRVLPSETREGKSESTFGRLGRFNDDTSRQLDQGDKKLYKIWVPGQIANILLPLSGPEGRDLRQKYQKLSDLNSLQNPSDEDKLSKMNAELDLFQTIKGHLSSYKPEYLSGGIEGDTKEYIEEKIKKLNAFKGRLESGSNDIRGLESNFDSIMQDLDQLLGTNNESQSVGIPLTTPPPVTEHLEAPAPILTPPPVTEHLEAPAPILTPSPSESTPPLSINTSMLEGGNNIGVNNYATINRVDQSRSVDATPISVRHGGSIERCNGMNVALV